MSTATLLQIVTEHCQRTALPVPTTVYGNPDKQVVQMLGLLTEGLEEMSQRGVWQELTLEATWSTIASTNQGDINLIATDGYRYMLPKTLWNRTNKVPLIFPIDEADWQLLMALGITGPEYSFRIRANDLLVSPAPPASETWAFEYVTENWGETAGGTGLSAFTADTNVVRLPKQIVKADLRWRWKKEKGLAYEEDFNMCEAMVLNALSQGRAKPTLNLGMNTHEPKPGVIVSPGSWPL